MQDIVWGLINGYIFSTILFLLLSIFTRSFRNRTPQYLGVANGLLLILLFINLLFWIRDTAWPFFTAGEKEYSWRVRNIYSYVYLLSVPVLGFLFQLLFVKKHFRTKKWTTIVSVVLLSLLVNLQFVIIAVSSPYRDYLPANWVYYAPTIGELLLTASFGVIYFVLCWIGSGQKKKTTPEISLP